MSCSGVIALPAVFHAHHVCFSLSSLQYLNLSSTLLFNSSRSGNIADSPCLHAHTLSFHIGVSKIMSIKSFSTGVNLYEQQQGSQECIVKEKIHKNHTRQLLLTQQERKTLIIIYIILVQYSHTNISYPVCYRNITHTKNHSLVN